MKTELIPEDIEAKFHWNDGKKITRQHMQAHPGGFPVHHYTHFRHQRLMFLGYDLTLAKEQWKGWGLKTLVDIAADTVVTQYEVRNERS